jgi:hypothetical protein
MEYIEKDFISVEGEGREVPYPIHWTMIIVMIHEREKRRF